MDDKGKTPKTINIIIPVYNEEKTILQVIERIKKLQIPLEKKIIVVDDASTDKTRNIIEKIDNISIKKHLRKQGKSKSIQTGLETVDEGLIIIQDGDLEYNPEDICRLLKIQLMNPGKIIYGSRLLKPGNWENKFYFGNKFLSKSFSIAYHTQLSDIETCYKMFHKDLIQDFHFRSNGFSIEIELTAKFVKKGFEIIETPIEYYPRTKDDGKKIRVIDGFKALFFIIYFRFFN